MPIVTPKLESEEVKMHEYILIVDRRRKFKVKLNRTFQEGDKFQVDGQECTVSTVVTALSPVNVYMRSTNV